MPNRLKEKVVIVTGAGSIGEGWGNGKATATLFAREGAKVLCADINVKSAKDTSDLIIDEGGDATVFGVDVSDSNQVYELIETAVTTYGRIDILHNNVGIAEIGGPVEASEESWDRVHDVNLKSAFLTCKHVIPLMQDQGEGSIVNVSSISGER